MDAAVTQAQLGAWWGPALAFAAGAVSFASPCVFPLVPGYVSFVSGGATPKEGIRPAVTPMLLFIAGFTIIFTLLGIFASSVGSTFVKVVQGTTGQAVAGGVVILIGALMILYAFQRGRIGLYADRRPFLQKVRPGMWGAMPLGMAFAAGWTPCIGPALAAILTIAASSNSPERGALLLVCYSFGLGLPFLLVGLGIQKFLGAFGWMRRNYKWVTSASGALLVAVGVLIATGWFTRLLAPLAGRSPAL